MLIQVIIRLIVYTDQLVSRPNDLEESSSVQTQNHGIDNTVSCKRGFLPIFFIFNEKSVMFISKDFFFILLSLLRDDKKTFLPFSVCKSVWVLDTDTVKLEQRRYNFFSLRFHKARLLFDGSTLKAGS